MSSKGNSNNGKNDTLAFLQFMGFSMKNKQYKENTNKRFKNLNISTERSINKQRIKAKIGKLSTNNDIKPIPKSVIFFVTLLLLLAFNVAFPNYNIKFSFLTQF